MRRGCFRARRIVFLYARAYVHECEYEYEYECEYKYRCECECQSVHVTCDYGALNCLKVIRPLIGNSEAKMGGGGVIDLRRLLIGDS